MDYLPSGIYPNSLVLLSYGTDNLGLFHDSDEAMEYAQEVADSWGKGWGEIEWEGRSDSSGFWSIEEIRVRP